MIENPTIESTTRRIKRKSLSGQKKRDVLKKKERSERDKERRLTLVGFVALSYKGMSQRAKKRGNGLPFSLEEFRDWLFKQENLLSLFYAYQYSGFVKQMRPTVDRIHSDKCYSFGNMRIVTLNQNIINFTEEDKVKNISSRRIFVKATNKITGETYKFSSMRDCSIFLKTDHTRVSRAIKTNGEFRDDWFLEKVTPTDSQVEGENG